MREIGYGTDSWGKAWHDTDNACPGASRVTALLTARHTRWDPEQAHRRTLQPLRLACSPQQCISFFFFLPCLSFTFCPFFLPFCLPTNPSTHPSYPLAHLCLSDRPSNASICLSKNSILLQYLFRTMSFLLLCISDIDACLFQFHFASQQNYHGPTTARSDILHCQQLTLILFRYILT